MSATMQLVPVPTACPKCGGKLWDNRESKKNPKQPDFKCRDKACEGLFWPLRGAQVWADKAPAAAPYAPPSYGPPIPGIDEVEREEKAALKAVTTNADGDRDWPYLKRIYGECLLFAANDAAKVLQDADVGATPETVASIAATLFIARTRRAA